MVMTFKYVTREQLFLSTQLDGVVFFSSIVYVSFPEIIIITI
jgi:hypothetical protein